MFDNTSLTNQSAPPDNLPGAPLDDMFSGVDPAASVADDSAKPPDALQAGLLKKKTMVNALPAELATPESENPEPASVMVSTNTRPPIIGAILKWIFIIVGIVVIGGGVLWVYLKLQKNKTSAIIPEQTQTPLPVIPPAAPAPVSPLVVPPPQVPAPTPVTSSDAASASLNDKVLFGEQADKDKDGLSDTDETNVNHTDPQKADTDGDGLTDGDEVKKYHTDPLKIDTDNDGLTDGAEVLVWHTDQANADTDGDTYPDGREVYNGYNPLGEGRLPEGVPTSTGVIYRPPTTTAK